ncbi:MAG: tetratricopeptide repeat protein, partial [Phycisphaerae bacterium]
QIRRRAKPDLLPTPWIGRLLPPVLIIAVGLVTYVNSFAGVFLFDDRLHILGTRRLETLWPLWEALARRRPVVDYSLAVNYVIGGESVWSYHAVNLAIHILAGLTLYGIVRRTLLREVRVASRLPLPDGRGSGRASTWLALVVALIWVVHPLQTQAVTYLIQRAESLMGLFYLLTLYCVIRGVDSPRRVWWYLAAVVSCALGMGSKAVMVTAPVVVLLYDRVFVSKSVGEILRRRWGLYLGLAASWSVLWACGITQAVLNPSVKTTNIGFGFKGITPLEYMLTQCGVLAQYLKLSLWPHPLCLDYYWPVARTADEIVPFAIPILVLVSVILWALFNKPALGFVGACFFLILAPTSSFIPIKDPLFEHRMYLSLAAVTVIVVIGADFVLRYLTTRLSLSEPIRRVMAAGLVVLVVGSLGYGTIRRNEMYHSEVSMWRDVLSKRPGSPRAAENLGTALLAAGEMEEAIKELQNAVRINPYSFRVHNGLGFALVAQGRLDEAIESFREAVRLKPTFIRAHLNLGSALTEMGRIDEAADHFRAVLWAHPNSTEAHYSLGNALFSQGHIEQAIEEYRKVLQNEPGHDKAWGNLGTALLNTRRVDEAVRAFHEALRANPDSESAHNGLGIALATKGKLEEAIGAFRQALSANPRFADAHYNLANCLDIKGETDGAIRHYKAALSIRPFEPQYHFDLALALEKQGHISEAIEEYQHTLRIRPDHAGARKALEAALAKQEHSVPD